jgi:8-oxo-dGTP diphosphatase
MAALLVAAAVIVEGPRVLLTQRPGGTHLESLWEFPGGKVEDGEAPEDALARELREELGIEARATGILEVTFWQYPKRDVLLLFYRAERVGGAAIQHLGVAAHAWVGVDELASYAMPPADVPVLAKVRALLAGEGAG